MKKSLIIWLVFFPLALHAEKISIIKAKNIATQFLQASQPTRGTSIQLESVDFSYDSFYIFNNQDKKGFVIVSADDRTSPILGFSTEGSFNTKDLPDNINFWFRSLQQQMTCIRQRGPVQRSEATPITPVVQLKTANWNQGYPYNIECPVIDGNKCPTGCVNTAAAIIMRYHKWPEQGKGTLPSYQMRYYGQTITIPERELGKSYDWDEMPLNYDSNSSKTAKEQIARFMFDIGCLTETKYSPSGSGGNLPNLVKKLPVHMGYDESIHQIHRNQYPGDLFYPAIQDELTQNGPILLTNQNHALVIDGYANDNFFHLNWGWGGYNNGWYKLELNPNNLPAENATLLGSCIFGIRKNNHREESQEQFILSNMSIVSPKITLNEPFKISCVFGTRAGFNLPEAYTGSVWLTDAEGERKEKLSEEFTIKENSKNYFEDLPCVCRKGFKPGDHIRIFCKSAITPTWTLPYYLDNSICEITIKDQTGLFATIEGKISYKFDVNTQTMTLTYPEDVSIKVFHFTNDITSQCTVTATSCQINYSKIKHRTITVIFTQGDFRIKKSFSFIKQNLHK